MSERQLTDDQRQAMRRVLTLGMEAWSEENYAASWLTGLEHKLWHDTVEPEWRTYGLLLGEWPALREWNPLQPDQDEYRWVPVDQWESEHRCWHAEHPTYGPCALVDGAA